MKASPKVSVVVPTKYAGKSIYATIDTVLSQSYTNLELVVSDASYSSELPKILSDKNDLRISYVNPPENLSFSDDWNFALEAATGDYITFLGDDDALLPSAVEFSVNVFLKTKVSAFVWNKINYNWPDHLVPDQCNVLEGESAPILYTVSAAKALRLASRFQLGYSRLPCIYNSLISREIIETIRKSSPASRFFSGVIPDVYSSIAVAAAIDRYAYAMFPLSVNGAARHSSGVKQGIPKLSEDLKKTIPDALGSGNRYHPDIGPFSSSIASIVMGEYFIAKATLKEFYFPDPKWRPYIKYMVREAKYSSQPDLILNAARHTKLRRGIRVYVPSQLAGPRDVSAYKLTSYFRGRLTLDASVVSNVGHAAKLCHSLIPKEFVLNNYSAVFTILRANCREIISMLIRLYQLFRIKY